jgi:hypothetical protein
MGIEVRYNIRYNVIILRRGKKMIIFQIKQALTGVTIVVELNDGSTEEITVDQGCLLEGSPEVISSVLLGKARVGTICSCFALVPYDGILVVE